jgi:2-hydroxy-3-keto-5-methylthiopentenyl-1-phosphate phosphatase
MQLWWESALSVFKRLGLKEEHLDTIDVSHVELREGMAEAFAFFAQENIPVLILSAGIQQTIEKVLAYHHLESSNVTLVANQLLFDEE